MEMFLLEIRDHHTFIPVLAVNLNPARVDVAGGYLLRRHGYPCDGSAPIIGLTRLSADHRPFSCDPHGWGDRTFTTAHKWIRDNWHTMFQGRVVDVAYILGETKKEKQPERIEALLEES
jgi:hypothetical protein